MSWRNLPEYGHLAQEQAETRMEDLQREAEFRVGKLGVSDVERARSEPGRQEQAPTEQLEEIVLAAEDQCAFAGIDRQRHTDAAADIFLKASRTGEALARMDDLRKSLSARIEAGPGLVAPHPALPPPPPPPPAPETRPPRAGRGGGGRGRFEPQGRASGARERR